MKRERHPGSVPPVATSLLGGKSNTCKNLSADCRRQLRRPNRSLADHDREGPADPHIPLVATEGYPALDGRLNFNEQESIQKRNENADI
jgi:hypothetical protein